MSWIKLVLESTSARVGVCYRKPVWGSIYVVVGVRWERLAALLDVVLPNSTKQRTCMGHE